MAVEVTVDEKSKTVTIKMPLQEPRLSKGGAGKNLVFASTGGAVRAEGTVRIKGKDREVKVGVNAFFRPEPGE